MLKKKTNKKSIKVEDIADWVFTKNKLPKENHTVNIYGLRKKSDNEDEIIEGIYEDGRFMMYNENTTDMEEVDSVYAWKYRN